MSSKWLEAAARYEAAMKAGFKAQMRKPVTPEPIPTLSEFMDSAEGHAAKVLLAAVGRSIVLENTGNGITILLSGSGLERRTHLTSENIDALEATRAIAEIGGDGRGVLYLHRELDQIADGAP